MPSVQVNSGNYEEIKNFIFSVDKQKIISCCGQILTSLSKCTFRTTASLSFANIAPFPRGNIIFSMLSEWHVSVM